MVYVIEYENEVVGDFIIKKINEEQLYLIVICVIPKLHNLGIGKKAIEYMGKDNP
ncbi:MAG: GNAT family N-acetyltransferase [Fusobacteriaceae bacterium]|nr:GNAT family N-acetyltransferase [Fusobacteriaceae bacterium]